MKPINYPKRRFGSREVIATIVSMTIGVGILTLPRELGEETKVFDGTYSILIAGLLSILFSWVTAKVALSFQGRNFNEYASSLLSKPVGISLTLLMAVFLFMVAAFQIRSIAEISKVYLFDRTPTEAITLTFLFLILYGVSGKSIGIIQLNLLFLMPVIIIVLLVQVMNIPYFKISNVMPIYVGDWSGILKGVLISSFAYIGGVILLPYGHLITEREKVASAAVKGSLIVVLIYTLIYTFCIGVFSREGTENIIYPTVEIAKEIEVPGGFFDRFESLFYVIWIMTIFNTTVMCYDASLLLLQSVFPKVKKPAWIMAFSPVAYFLAMFPQGMENLSIVGRWIGYAGVSYSITVPCLLLVAEKVRRGDSGA